MSVTISNAYLSLSEQQGNAAYIVNYFRNRGWTDNAIAGLLGNMESESTINPGLWESMDYGNTSRGFGLTQWTPATKLIDWAESNALNYEAFDTQLERIAYEVTNGDQWIPSLANGMTFLEWTQSTDTPYNLAMLFLTGYERPANQDQPNRGTQAETWFTWMGGVSTSGQILVDWALSKVGNNHQEFTDYMQIAGDWCVMFVCKGVHDCNLQQLFPPDTGSTNTYIAGFTALNIFMPGGTTPQPGWIIFFNWDGDSLSDHTAIVEKVVDGTVHTREGNYGITEWPLSTVQQGSYSVNDSRISGYGAPIYSGIMNGGNQVPGTNISDGAKYWLMKKNLKFKWWLYNNRRDK